MTAFVSATTPWEVFAVSLLLLVATAVAEPLHRRWHLPSVIALLVLALFVGDPRVAYGAIAGAALVHAASAFGETRTGAAMLVLSAVVAAAVAIAIAVGATVVAFWLSVIAIALRAGVLPLHTGVAALCDRAPVVQTQQLAFTVALVFLHLRYVDHIPEALAAGPWIVRVGAGACLLAALVTVVQQDLRGFYRGTTAMHGGMLLAGIGAAGLGNFAAALLVVVSMGVAVGGMGMMITSLEERVGPVSFRGPGGRAAAFPRLALAFALFGGAGVGLPGMAGFVADDLLLHTLWTSSPTSTVAVIVASALLAVATLVAFARTFLGRQTLSLAPDLYPRERVVAVALIGLLLLLGVAPGVLLLPADTFLSLALPF